MNQLYLWGDPLGHSVSPEMQNAGLRACGLTDWDYALRPLSPSELKALLADRGRRDWAGANVTIPYKQVIIPWLDELSDAAREIGAVNTVIRSGDRLIGENTDAYGFLAALRGASVPRQGAYAAILGAGGAARAAAWVLAREGVGHIAILNRTRARGQELVAEIEGRFPGLASLADSESLKQADLVINATPLGMAPYVDALPLAADQVLKPGAWLMDLVYNPIETKLLKRAAQMGVHTLGGLEMLVQQGACAFECWAGRPAPVGIMREAAQRALETRAPL